ncbi:Vitamin B12 import ATP-binding protein BtuD [bioreactor metagenome]|uniref:Vitamin B12 import ATP-binding protein BtuD n=1 Tax=bioreactor metagenome TaxID=1076179 RepID=A0A645ABF7_9ZZZZ|nr:ABC transporter ATP-binding protein [Oscillospiraceae bacterium]
MGAAETDKPRIKNSRGCYKKTGRINQIDFQNSEFFDLYTLGLNEIDVRAVSVLNSVASFLTAFLNFQIVFAVTATINNSFAFFGVIAAVFDFGLSIIKQKLYYKQNIDTTPDDRKRGYINRVTYQPEFTSDLKIYPNFIDLLVYRYKKATYAVKAIILKYSWKILLLDQCQQIPGTIFRYMIPWIYIAILLANGQISIPEATVLSASTLSIAGNLTSFMISSGSFYSHSLYINNLRKIYNYKEKIECDSGENINPSAPINIRVEDVSFSYTEKEINTINNIIMNINHGDKIAIVGYNGAGKTTLVKLLIHLYDIDGGKIIVNDRNISEYKTKSLRSRIAFLSQDFKIYNFSLAENVLMRPVLSNDDINLVNTALKKVGLYDKIIALSNGINTFITREFDETGTYFSGGEMQKLALARIYAGNYDCIILDESTSALDPVSEDEIIRTIFEIFKDKTIIMISHRLVTVKYVDRIYFMSHGCVCESGTHQELMSNGGDYCKFYSTQANKFQI